LCQGLPLLIAAKSGDIDQIRKLADQDVLVNYTDYEGKTSLHWAARNGHTDVIPQLVQMGADVDASDGMFRRYTYEKMKKNEWDEGLTPLHMAVMHGHVNAACELLVAHANPNAAYHGITPLCVASQDGQLDLVKLLVRHGARVNGHEIGEEGGVTPLYWARLNGHDEVARFLEQRGATANMHSE
jgi:ankyrin repeat protein